KRHAGNHRSRMARFGTHDIAADPKVSARGQTARDSAGGAGKGEATGRAGPGLRTDNEGGKGMNNLLTVGFEAHHAELNHHRRYEITVGRDLIGDWTVCIRYGRIGQVRRFAGPHDGDTKAVVRDRLRRRLSAPKRIECAYRMTKLNTA